MYNNYNSLNYYPRAYHNMDMNGMHNMMNMYSDMSVTDKPTVFNIQKMSINNMSPKTEVWKGKHMQVYVMHLNVNESLGLEAHPMQDQFIHIVEGQGMCVMGDSENNLTYKNVVTPGSCIIVPAGTYHDLVNTGAIPLKCFSIYAPPSTEKE